MKTGQIRQSINKIAKRILAHPALPSSRIIAFRAAKSLVKRFKRYNNRFNRKIA